MCQPQKVPVMINMTITKQPSTSVCPTIKSNARLRRSRKWRDQQSNNGENTTSNINKAASKRKNIRRRPSSPKKDIVVDDSSSISCASTASMSTTSFDSCASPPTKKSNNNRSSKGTKKNKKSTRRRPTPKVIFAELTPEEKSNYLAIDCEMVGIGPSGYTSRLARVSIVNYDGEIVYDTHVKVDEPVTDYRTFVSGITAEDLMSESAVTFDEAQSHVMSLIQDKILVGHGLKNDFKVLGITHPWYLTRDTAKYEPFCKVPGPNDYNPTNAQFIPKKLKVLAKDKLGMIIQEEGKCHCPVEDAVAALELYKKHSGKWEKVIEYKLSKTREILTGSQ